MITPTQDYRRIEAPAPTEVPKHLDALSHGVLGRSRRSVLGTRTIWQQMAQVDALSSKWEHTADRRLRDELQECREVFRRNRRDKAKWVVRAIAAVREAAQRQTGLRPYPVQIAGAVALHEGFLAEMATGEGKTLTAAVAAVLAGWTGKPCHIITVNDYLAERDAKWFRSLYAYCGLSVGHVISTMDLPDRRRNYDCDVTYTTSKEVVADFLRDRLRLGQIVQASQHLLRQLLAPQRSVTPHLAMRGLYTAIVDEADSVLVDEAVTPLIISRERENRVLLDAVRVAHGITQQLEPGRDYIVDARYKETELTPQGMDTVAASCEALPGVWQGSARRRELVEQSLNAREFFARDKQYVVQDEKVVIVDEFTGRLMPQRTWREGLHQAIEAAEGIDISEPTETLARLSFQRFFRLYRKISGMTGTAMEAANELWQVYSLPVITIPTNRPCIRKQLPDQFFHCAPDKWDAVVEDIVAVHEQGRPLLVGTRSVQASERLAEKMDARGLTYNLLNAVRHKEEARVVAEAGQPARITIATNMAGRGTDIKLGHGVAELGGLHVIATERHESGRIDRQLFGRCARQGDPGSAQAFVGADDELLVRHVSGPVRSTLTAAMKRRAPGASLLGAAAVKLAQGAAQAMAYKQRVSVLRTDTWLEDALSFTGRANQW